MSPRPRGFIHSYSPTAKTAMLIGNVRSILEDNSDILPLTLRQIFYMLVTGYEYDKTEQAYKRLCETLNRARRARMIDMTSIRDDGLRREDPYGWDSAEQLVDTFRWNADKFRLHRQEGQPTHLMVWCEAAGMLPQLATACEEYGVPVISSGGFDSVTTKHNFAYDVSDFNAVEILHIGDHDPSGVHMHSSLDEDLRAFVDELGGIIEVTRLAVVPDQVRAMGLPTAPAKTTDNRAFSGRTTQAEAIPPRRLREIVQDAITDRLDLDLYEELLEREAKIRAGLTDRLDNLFNNEE